LPYLAFLAGGTWTGEGRWPDGSGMRVEVRYFWGPTRHVLHFETYDLEGGERRLLYEGMIMTDPTRGGLEQWNVKPTGEVDVSEVTRADSTGFDVRGAHTRSTVVRTGPDAFLWRLDVPAEGGWSTVLQARYTRASGGVRGGAAGPPRSGRGARPSGYAPHWRSEVGSSDYRLYAQARGLPANPSLFHGLSGIGYLLLRWAEPHRFPCLLLWQ
jgi:hypothetical protein